MLQKTLESSAVLKLRQMISERFGKDLEIRQLMDTKQDLKAKPFMRGESFHIPLVCSEHYVGVAIIPDALNLPLASKEQAADLVKMVLEPTLYSWFLEKSAQNLEEQLKVSVDEEISEEDLFADLEDEAPEDSHLISNFIHLSGTNATRQKKVALQIHDLAHRWAFVPFSDLGESVKTVADLLKLGAMTIWIEDIEKLNAAQMDLLVEFNSEDRSQDCPLIITASSYSLAELERNEDIPALLMDEISVNCFEVDRAPVSFASLKEVLELFFFKGRSGLDS